MIEKFVLHVIPSLSPKHGGPTTAVKEMVIAQRKLGIRSVILTSDDDVGKKLDVVKFKWVRWNNIPVLYLPRIASRNHTLIGFTFAPAFLFWYFKYLKKFSFVHFHTVFSFPVNLGFFFCWIYGLPYAVRPLGQLCHWSLGQRSTVKKLQLFLYTRFFLKRAFKIHVTSQMEYQESYSVSKSSNYLVLAHGITPGVFLPYAREVLFRKFGIRKFTGLVFLFFSRIHKKKGIEELLQALKDIGFDFVLIICGSGEKEYEKSVKEKVRDYSLQKKIFFLGHVEGVQKEEIFSSVDVFVLTSYSENFGLSVAESIVRSVPVLVSKNVALSYEVEKYNVGLSIDLDVLEIKKGIENIFNNPGQIKVWASNCKRLAEDCFSWEKNAQILKAVYQV